jgi:6-phosphogluconolactonase
LLIYEKTQSGGLKLEQIMYIGTWSDDIHGNNKPEKGKGGVYSYKIDTESVMFTKLSHVASDVNAGGLCVSYDGKHVYSTDERKDYGGIFGMGGGVCAYSSDQDGSLSLVNTVSSAGAYPCYIVIDKKNRYAFVSNHGNHEETVTVPVRREDGTYVGERKFDQGSIAMFPLHEDGSIGACCDLVMLSGKGPVEYFQWTPHPHSVFLDPSEQFLLCGEKGTDRILVFLIDYENGKLLPVFEQIASSGSGPRHIAFHPELPILYCNSELDNTVHGYSFDTNTGSMVHQWSCSTVPDDYKPGTKGDVFDNNAPADIRIHKSGKYMYVSNRGEDSIAEYSLDLTGKMSLMGFVSAGGSIPRAMNFDLTGDYLYVADQRSNRVVQFYVDPQDGSLHETGRFIKINNPANIQFAEYHKNHESKHFK